MKFNSLLPIMIMLAVMLAAAATGLLGGGQIEVISPDNSSALASGENILLSATVGGSNSLLYSLDNSANATMSGNVTLAQGNYTSVIQGTLPGNVIANGAHKIVMYSFENVTANTTGSLEFPFVVQDTNFPAISTTPQFNNTAASSINQSYQVRVESDEYANISYTLNSGQAVFVAATAHSANISLTPSQGSNILALSAVDMQGNAHSYSYRFNFSINGSGTCTDAAQNYHDNANETGIDCGGPCSACTPFNVTTDKDSYLPGDTVYVYVQARSDTRHNITVTGPSYRVSFALYNGSTYYIISPPAIGLYAVNVSLKYRNLSPEYVVKNFLVNSSNTLSVSIAANATTINRGDIVWFKPSVAGNISTISYKWDLNGDSTADSTATSVNYTYAAPGSYTANLTVSDGTSAWTATTAITVRPFYNLTVNVKGTANETIPSAIVTINGESKAAAPSASYSLPLKDYTVHINGSGYDNVTSSISFGENDTLSYKLHIHDDQLPLISLASPADNMSLEGPNLTLQFTVNDATLNTCTAYLNREKSGWQAKSTAIAANSAQQEIRLSGLENASYQWRVDCIDEASNANSSETRSFLIQPASQAIPAAEYNSSSLEANVSALVEEINSVMLRISSYEQLEQEASETLQLLAGLEKDKTELQRVMRDVSNVKWRRFNASDEAAFIAGKTNDVETIAGNITTDISVVKNAKFVNYAAEKDVLAAAGAYLQSIGMKASKKELEKYVADNRDVQQGAVITTDYKVVELKMRNGDIRRITLLTKTIDFREDLSGVILLESVPKEIAKNVSEITPLFEYGIVKEDPIISVKLPEDRKYAYYLEKELTQAEVQRISPVLIKSEFKPSGNGGGGITGFAVFSGDSPLADPGTRLVAEIIIAMLLGGLYLAYSKGFLHARDGQLKRVNLLVEQIREALSQGDYAESKKRYSEVNGAFKLLKPENRGPVYETLSELRYEIDACYVAGLIKETNALLIKGEYANAKNMYAKLSGVYKSLPKENRKGVYESCANLHEKMRIAK